MVVPRASRLKPFGPTTAPATISPINPGTRIRSNTIGASRKITIASAKMSTGSVMGSAAIVLMRFAQPVVARGGPSPGARNISVFRDRGVDLIRPGEDASLEIPQPLEALLAQELERTGAARPGAALQHDLLRGIELVQPIAQLSQWDQ